MSFKDEKIVKVEKEEKQEDEYWFEKIKEVEIEREREMDKKIEELSGGKEWKDMSEEEKEKVSDYIEWERQNSLMLSMIIIKCVVCVTFVRGILLWSARQLQKS